LFSRKLARAMDVSVSRKGLNFMSTKKALFNMEDKVKRISRQPMFDSCHQQKQSAMWIFSLSIRW